MKQKSGNVIIITEKITEYILGHKSEFDLLKDQLNSFIIEFPNSEWFDDANILLGAAYLTVNLKETPFSQEAINIYSKILEIERDLNISAWTKHLLSDLNVSCIFEPLPSENWMVGLKENDVIKIIFSRAIVTEYLKRKDFNHAELLVNNFRNRHDIIGFPQNIESLKQFISNWGKRSNLQE